MFGATAFCRVQEAKLFAEHDLDAGDMFVLEEDDLSEMGVCTPRAISRLCVADCSSHLKQGVDWHHVRLFTSCVAQRLLLLWLRFLDSTMRQLGSAIMIPA